MGPQAAPSTITYLIRSPKRVAQFTVALASPPIAPEEPPPAWTDLGTEQCPNCPLDPAVVRHCPLAQALVPLVRFADGMRSFEEVEVTIVSTERTIVQVTSIQRVLGSLMGLLSALSGCPRTAPLQPMALFHLPLAGPEETLFRVVGMYLTAQLLRSFEGLPAAEGLSELTGLYAELETVNRAMANRLRAAMKGDAGVNALIILDMLGKTVPFSVEDRLIDLKPAFEAWLKG